LSFFLAILLATLSPSKPATASRSAAIAASQSRGDFRIETRSRFFPHPLADSHHRESVVSREQVLFSDIMWAFRAAGIQTSATLVVSSSLARNAFARGGNTVVVSEGLLALLTNNSERAFVLAHELAHIALRHSVKSGLPQEVQADHIALQTLRDLHLDPCAGFQALARLSAPSRSILSTISARLTILAHETFQECD
jgi:Zn-dependent protease with chaperone function